jgi:hypothetical protein
MAALCTTGTSMNDNPLTHRRTLLPFLARRLKARSYLEIGVKGGKTFMPVKVRKKIAVDPVFRIKKPYKRSQIFSYPFNLMNQYFECTSDEFFAQHAGKVLTRGGLDLAFIDGLHTYEQSYKDIENTLPYLADDGVMLIHDCSPHSSAAAYPAESIEAVKKINPPGFDGRWCGDVWKVIPRLRIEHPQLNVLVIDADSGLGLVSKKPIIKNMSQPAKPELTVKGIAELTYADLASNRSAWLSIQDTNDLWTAWNKVLY